MSVSRTSKAPPYRHETRFRDVAELLPEAVFEMDRCGRVIFANDAAFDIFGYSPADFSDAPNAFSMLAPADRRRARQAFSRLLGGAKLEGREYLALRKDGSTFPVIVHAGAIRRGCRICGLRGIVADIGERRRIEEAIEESEGRYRDLFNSAGDAICIIDLAGNIRVCNPAAESLTGYDRRELERMNIAALISGEDLQGSRARLRELFKKKGADQRWDLGLRRKDGNKLIVELVARLLAGNGRPAAVQAMIRDVTERRRAGEQMRSYVKEITRAQEEERKRIARELHDETAQSLAALSLDIGATLSRRKSLDEQTRQWLAQLKERVDSVMEGVRRFSRELRPEVLDQLGLIPALETLADELNDDGRISATVEVDGRERRLKADAELALFRIAQEALNNVRRHSQATEARIKVQFLDRGKIRLTVTDNGKGFEVPDALADLTNRSKLGLLGMQERARLLDGIWTIRSSPGAGTEVAIEVAG